MVALPFVYLCGGIFTKGESMMVVDSHNRERVTNYISDVVWAISNDLPEPSTHDLTAAELAEARAILAEIDTSPNFEVDIPPLAEDPIAVMLGIVPEPALVPINAAAVQSTLREFDPETLLQELTRYLPAHHYCTVDAALLDRLNEGTVKALAPRVVRVLAAVLRVDRERLLGDDLTDCQMVKVPQVSDDSTEAERKPMWGEGAQRKGAQA